MKPEDNHYFNLLKQAITSAFLTDNSASMSIKDWKGEDITAFQEDLFNKVKTTISEKWFYTYIKNEPKKLPRIDMLNMLSKYVGFDNWAAFKNTHSRSFNTSKNPSAIKNYAWLLLLIPITAILIYFVNTKNEFEFCFIDEDKNETISTILDIKILQEFESPIYVKTDSLGCFTYKTEADIMKFVVQSPYYKTDTIIRSINTNSNATIKLQTDDYALMLHYYSNGNIKDWKKRKQQLKKLIADDAQIYQVFTHDIGVEVYSKDDFISKLTIPTSSLKNIKILDKTSKDGKIVKLKFMIQ
ncbi:MAG: hypothetical protein L3J20_10730 [Flavobacteriaceae bacterium]|nr:hypothetical protein [Flavobacteriaceae bacterium]